MAKVILMVDIPEDCYKIKGELICYGSEQIQDHMLDYDEEDIELGRVQYNDLQKQWEKELDEINMLLGIYPE